MPSRSQPRTAARETVALDLQDVQIEAQVWRASSGWNASTRVERREYRIMGAAGRADALDRLRASLLASGQATAALGIKSPRHWAPNPFWKGK